MKRSKRRKRPVKYIKKDVRTSRTHKASRLLQLEKKSQKQVASLQKGSNRKKQKQEKRIKIKKIQKRQRIVMDILLTNVIVLVILMTVFVVFFRVETNDGYGMSPLIQANDKVIISKYSNIERFSVVSFQVPNRQNQSLIRRIIGLPGEEIRYLDDELWVDGRQITERFLIEQLQQAYQDGFQVTEDFTMRELPGEYHTRIPDGFYLVLGDNRSFSVDSRAFGLVAATDITGVVEMVVYPWQRFGGIE
ncbi:signal peptidase I [Enterococcus sp. HY326]|uniref:signal peptidase I n=1 Tax=Enterococcus sp. HY326 TaxID=2971265 RepID=UPI00223E9DA6|nr:signal peptidase I [Enterococcus sp. HY326]